MSDFLLQKSCRLLQESKHNKKVKDSQIQKLKKKKNSFNVKELKEQQFENNITGNLKKLEELNQKTTVIVSEVVLAKCNKNPNIDDNSNEKIEESTVFTDKDFEDFEKEYFGS